MIILFFSVAYAWLDPHGVVSLVPGRLFDLFPLFRSFLWKLWITLSSLCGWPGSRLRCLCYRLGPLSFWLVVSLEGRGGWWPLPWKSWKSTLFLHLFLFPSPPLLFFRSWFTWLGSLARYCCFFGCFFFFGSGGRLGLFVGAYGLSCFSSLLSFLFSLSGTGHSPGAGQTTSSSGRNRLGAFSLVSFSFSSFLFLSLSLSGGTERARFLLIVLWWIVVCCLFFSSFFPPKNF